MTNFELPARSSHVGGLALPYAKIIIYTPFTMWILLSLFIFLRFSGSSGEWKANLPTLCPTFFLYFSFFFDVRLFQGYLQKPLLVRNRNLRTLITSSLIAIFTVSYFYLLGCIIKKLCFVF